MTEEFIKITPGQRMILDAIKEMKPYEEMRIVADKDGHPDSYFIQRTSKVIVKGFFAQFVK